MKCFKVSFLVNPISGGGRGREVHSLLPEVMASFGYADGEWTAEFTSLDRLDEQIDQLSERSERLIAVGGDGTMNAVMSRLARQSDLCTSVGLVPLGTGNDLARVLGIYRNFVDKGLANTLRKLVTARSVLFDLWGLPGGRTMGAYLSAGLDAEVTRAWNVDRAAGRIPFSSPLVNKAWYLPIFWRNRNRRLPAGSRVRWEEPGGGVREQELEGKCTLLVGNISSYAAGASPLAGNDFGDGLLRMLFLPNLSSFFFALGATRSRFGSWLFRTLHPVKTARCVEFFLPAGEALQIDGEMVEADKEGMTGRWVRISRLGRVRLLSLE